MQEELPFIYSDTLKFKIIIVGITLVSFNFQGDLGVGKSNMLSRYTRNVFKLENQYTCGVEIETKSFTIGDTLVNVNLWDTTG